MKYIVTGRVTVSCWTTVEADTAEEARLIAEQRSLASLCHQAFSSEGEEEWLFDDDGEPEVDEVMPA